MADDNSPVDGTGLDTKDIFPVQIEDEMRDSYIDYAMSVIVSRALPDVRDGLKPVHRRILFGMHELGVAHNKPFKKSARIVGEVMGKYHPHGDSAIYDTLVRMAQDFSLRYCLVDGQGNFGSIDGDPAAAMRYTEARLQRIAEEMLADIEKETVPFQPNFDDSLREPTVLPARIPNLLVNGSDGIAVGMATKIPPHNLGEVIDALVAMIQDPDITLEKIFGMVKGPDFPTGGYIVSSSEILQAYKTGRGRVVMRAKSHVETLKTGKERIIVSEIPYQVNKAKLIQDIAELVKDKKVEGIADLRDESDRKGMRIVIELKKGENAELITNQLLKFTQLQQTFGINMVALVDNRPLVLNLRRMCREYLRHRRDVVIRRTRYELRKALERLHILEGLKIALDNIDEVIDIIKKASNVDDARGSLMKRFALSQRQAQAILDMRLQKLTSLETEKVMQEYEETQKLVQRPEENMADIKLVWNIVKEELLDVKAKYADGRRTTFIHDTADFDPRDLLQEETKVITVSAGGYIKSIAEDTYRRQRRGGKGLRGVGLKDEDVVETVFVANTFDNLLFFTNRGKVYSQEVWKIPEGERTSKGRPLVNLLNLEKEETVTAILPIKEFDDQHFIFMATALGTVKKTVLSDFSRPRTAGIIAINLDEGDRLVGVAITSGVQQIMLFSNEGKANRFFESEVRSMGRVSRGVRGIKMPAGAEVISLLVADTDDEEVLTATENGYGKRTPVGEYRQTGRGTQGVIAISTSARNGKVVAAVLVKPEDEVMLITTGGVLIRTRVKEIRAAGRSTQGVTLINLGEGEKLSGLQPVLDSEDEE